MGASEWYYEVPYQPDVAAALQSLRDKVFAEGDYYRDDSSDEGEGESADEVRARIRGVVGEIDDESLEQIVSHQLARQKFGTPSSIDELLEAQAENGTHSILDMSLGVSRTPQFGTVSPLSEEQLMETFGTTLPHSGVVASWVDRGGVDSYRGRWEGACLLLAGENGSPAQIAFAGFSGD